MAGVTFTLEAPELDDVLARLDAAIGGWPSRGARFLDAAGAVMESGVRKRIGETKRAPDGAAWPGWSESYGATRRPGQSLLQAEGDLLDSIQSLSDSREARTGSNLVYAAIHQFGGEDVGKPIPPRPYLGLDAEDERGLRDLAGDFLRGGLA